MSQVNFVYEFGDELKCKVSGFKGIVMVRAEYATGCTHYGLQSRALKDGQPQDWKWIDQSQLELKKSNAVKFNIPAGTTSGPFPSGSQS